VDRITLQRIVAHGRHGANEGERDLPQPIHVDLRLDLDLSAAAQSDNLRDTVDYAGVYQRIIEIIETRSYALLERLAAAILESVMSDSRILRAELTIAKPGLLDGATPSVTLVRVRESLP
jgi:dihydroneopterin aldolase